MNARYDDCVYLNTIFSSPSQLSRAEPIDELLAETLVDAGEASRGRGRAKQPQSLSARTVHACTGACRRRYVIEVQNTDRERAIFRTQEGAAGKRKPGRRHPAVL